MKNIYSLYIITVVLLISNSAFSLDKGKLILSGSSTIAPLISEIGKKFELENKGIRIDVQTGGSSKGIADVKSGLANIGMASRDLIGEEKSLTLYTIAIDGVAPLVHKDNPVKNLTKDQFRKILVGEIKNWKELGGFDETIVVANRAEGRSELGLVTKYLDIKTTEIKAHLIIGENSHGIKSVSRNRRVLTYLSIGHALKEIEFGAKIKLLSLEGIEATFLNVSSKKYPLSRSLNLITSSKASGLQKKFINFVKSKEVAPIVTAQSFVPISGR